MVKNGHDHKGGTVEVSKGSFYSESSISFKSFSNLQISKKRYFKSLTWGWNLNLLFIVIVGKFKFQVQDSDLEYF